MKFRCVTNECKHKGQEITLKAEQLTPYWETFNIKKYQETGEPFFYTIPPIYCGYCGSPAKQVTE